MPQMKSTKPINPTMLIANSARSPAQQSESSSENSRHFGHGLQYSDPLFNSALWYTLSTGQKPHFAIGAYSPKIA